MDRAISVVTNDADGQFLSTVYASRPHLFRVEPQEYEGAVQFSQRGTEVKIRTLEGGEGWKVVLVGVPALSQLIEPPADLLADPATQPAENVDLVFDLFAPLPVLLPGSGDFLVQCVWAKGRRKVVLLAGDQNTFHTTVRHRLADVDTVDGNVIYLKPGEAMPTVAGFAQLL